MEKRFKAIENDFFSFVVASDGKKVGKFFPNTAKFSFDGNTVIADIRECHKSVNYRVMSYVDGRVKCNFDCSEVEKLESGNYRLKLIKSYDGEERSLIFDPEIGKPVSSIYEGMVKVEGDDTFLCTIKVNKRGCNFKYLLKINDYGEVVSYVHNCRTGENFHYDNLVNNENETIGLITEENNQDFLIGYGLVKIPPVQL